MGGLPAAGECARLDRGPAVCRYRHTQGTSVHAKPMSSGTPATDWLTDRLAVMHMTRCLTS